MVFVKMFLGFIALVLGVLYFAADSKSATINYRITVTMQTPDGEVSGSAVRGVKLPSSAPLLKLPDAPAKIKSMGEAVVIDLGDKGYVFALIKDSSWMELLDTYNYTYNFEGDVYQDQINFYQSLPKAKPKNIEHLSLWPSMVWFEDINDPKSVQLVYQTVREKPPYEGAYIKNDQSENLFGEGYAVVSVVIELTDEEITFGNIEKILPWIWNYKNKLFDDKEVHTINTRYPLANSLGAGSFTTGKIKK
jgi:hypothetical protein